MATFMTSQELVDVKRLTSELQTTSAELARARAEIQRLRGQGGDSAGRV